MKKIIKLLFLFTIVCLFSANILYCGVSKVYDQEKIVIWETYNSTEHAVFKELIKDYKITLPSDSKIDVEIKRVSFDGLTDKIMSAASTGDLPDICRISTEDVGRFAIGGLAVELDQFGAREHLNHLLPIATAQNLIEVTNESGTKAKLIYGITDQVTCLALFYNKKMFKKAGLKPPTTLKELIRAGKRLTSRKKKIFGLGLNNSLWWHLPWLYVHGADVFNENNTKCILNSTEAIKTFQFLKDLHLKHKIEGGAWIEGAVTPDQGFLDGKYAMIVSGQWMLKSFTVEKYGVTLFPGTKEIMSASNLGGTSMIIFKSSKNKKTAFEILKYLTSYNAQKVFSTKTKQPSVHRKVNAELKSTLNERQKVILEQMNHLRPRPRIANYSEMEVLINPDFYNILKGNVPVKDGLDQIVKKVETKILPKSK